VYTCKSNWSSCRSRGPEISSPSEGHCRGCTVVRVCPCRWVWWFPCLPPGLLPHGNQSLLMGFIPA
jgi:hypothetical protein